jgi:L-threonylcarbamoyladenylate synthase
VKVVKVDPASPDRAAIKEAARILREGGLVAFPTETVYGLAANMLDAKAVERLYRVKGRPAGKPLTVHIAAPDIMRAMAEKVPSAAENLIREFWPGPLTIILKTKDGNKTGFRMPSNRIALMFIEACGVPVVAPSANISGASPPTSAGEVAQGLDGNIDMVLDGGPTEVGMESTVVDVTASPSVVLRERAITISQIREAEGR